MTGRRRAAPGAACTCRDGASACGVCLAYGPRKAPDAVSPPLLVLSERQFQAIVVAALRGRGWVVWVVPNMRLTTAGLPDILAWHPRWPGKLLTWELKRERDYRVSPKQQAALAHLRTVPGVDARIVRPSDWPALLDNLDGEGAAHG